MHTRKLLDLVFPEGALLLLAVALVHWGVPSPSAAPILRLFPIVVLAAGAFLGWRFQRGRLLLGLLALVLADCAMRWLAPPESDAAHAGPVVVRTVAMLLPVIFAVLSVLGERGVLSAVGMRRLAALAATSALVLVIWLVAAFHPAGAERAFSLVLLPAPMFAWSPLGQPATLVALTAVAVLVGRVLWRPDAESRGFLWAAIGGTIAAGAGPEHGLSTPYLATAALVLVAATIESAYAMAYHDELTGLPARRALNDALLNVNGTYTVAMVDVDHFKKFNDTHGHDVGDQVLRMVAGRLGRVAGGGRAFRYGGEEFTVLFPGKTAEESAPHLESLREAVERATFTLRGKDRPKRKPKSPRTRAPGEKALSVTVSIGAAQARGRAVPDDVVKAADEALYRAKEGGRNRVAV
jgi:diguanylate cyclase (GGDEF)-like protein